jgi:peptide/nickel transport system permease protein
MGMSDASRERLTAASGVSTPTDVATPPGAAIPEGALPRQSRATGSRAWRTFRRHRLALVGTVFVAILVFLALTAAITSLQDPYHVDLRARGKPPSAQHVLGTDLAGRDVWARVVYGGRVSLSVGLFSTAIAGLIGVVLGGVAGYYRGVADQVLMRVTDVIMTMPTLVIILALVAYVGQNETNFIGAYGVDASVVNIIGVLGVLGWPGLARLVRGQFLSLREQDFVQAARSIGVSDRRIIFRHVLPNVVGPIVVWASFGVAGAILSEAALSFLGFGVATPTASWGNMLTAAQDLQVIENMLWLWIPPGVAVTVTVLCINFIGDALRDALDPRATAT